MKSSRKSLMRLCILFISLAIISCRKEIDPLKNEGDNLSAMSEINLTKEHGHLKQTKTFTSEVAMKWQDLHLRALRVPTGGLALGLNGIRHFAYQGIALYESVVPGMPAYRSLNGQLTGMPAMPSTEPGKAYHWPAAANAALAYMHRSFYATAPLAYKAAIDSLELALHTAYQTEVSESTLQRSVDFGKTVAQRIFDWSKTDGSLTVYPPYAPTAGSGLWSPTAPNPTAVFSPYWGGNRYFVPGSTNETDSPLPPPYSTVPGSAYYNMVKEVYDISQTLTPAQIATALYFRDNPGYPSGAHYVSIFNEIMHIENRSLDFYAVAHAKTGIAMAEAQIACWKMKYALLVDRPIKYIREVLNHPTWTPVLGTPPHPDYPSGHSQTGAAFAEVFSSLFGEQYHFTIHTYDDLGMAPRSYSSFREMADDIGKSRIYAGIHYTYSCTEGSKQGGKIATNILHTLQFKK